MCTCKSLLIIRAKRSSILRVISSAECIGICTDKINPVIYIHRIDLSPDRFLLHLRYPSITLLVCNLVDVLFKTFLLVVRPDCGLMRVKVIGADITMIFVSLTDLESRHKCFYGSCCNHIVIFLLQSSSILACQRCNNSSNSSQIYCWN